MAQNRLSRDRPFDAVWNFHQPERGYRFTADSLLLAEFARSAGAVRAADLGAGCGIVGLAALEKRRFPRLERLFFVEREPAFIPHLTKNLEIYRPRTPARLAVALISWNLLSPEELDGPLDYLLVNPPYYPYKSGRLEKHPLARAARREEPGGLENLARAAARLLRPGGRAAFCFPASRREELISTLGEKSMLPAREELIAEAGTARLVLLEVEKKKNLC